VLPNKVSMLELPLIVIWEMVEVLIVDDVMAFVPVNVVLPPCKVKVLVFKVNVPVPVVKVLPLTVVKVGVAVMVICVEVPIKTFCPPLMSKFDPTVKLPRVVVPMPPLEDVNTPLTSLEPNAMAPLNSTPVAVERTGRAEVKEDIVVEPETVKVPVMEEEAKKEAPLTVSPVEEALAKVDWPVTNKLPLVKTVVEALVTVKTLVVELKVKLVEVAKVLVPAPNRISLAVRFCSWIVGVVPVQGRMEPLQVMAVTAEVK
jgi:hypothetical protein